MARTVRVAGLQMLVTNEVAGNAERVLAGIARAAEDRADFLLTPEGSLSGYWAGFDRAEVEAAVERVTAAAREAHVGLALGTCYKEVEGEREFCYNQVRVYTPEGEYLGYHAKILRCSRLAHPGTGEMVSYVEGVLRTFEWHGVRFGCLICNDLWATPGFTTIPNPYLPWKLQQMGAQVILHAINSGEGESHFAFHSSSTERWSCALGLPIVSVNAVHASGKPLNAPSGVVLPEDIAVRVSLEGEGYFVYDVPVGG